MDKLGIKRAAVGIASALALVLVFAHPATLLAGSPADTRYFTEVPGAIPDLTPVYDGYVNGPTTFITPVDISHDGRDDILIHYWKFVNPSLGLVTDAPCTNRLVLLIQQADGTFVDQTTTYIVGPADLGACSRKSVVADVNSDGFQDVAFATNQEDGRSGEVWAQNEALSAVLVSRPDGRYAVETFGQPNWGHSIDVGYDAAGKPFVAAAGFSRPSQVFQRAANGAWLDISSGFPATNAATFLFSSSGAAATSDQLIQPGMHPDIMDIGGAYRDPSGTWHTVANLRIFEPVGTINVIPWNGSVQQDFVYPVGKEYFTFGGYSESCGFTLSPGAPVMTILKLDAGVIPGGYTEPDQVIHNDDITWNQFLFGFRLVEGTLQQASLPIAGEQTVFNGNFFRCRDVNGDGYMDITVYPYSSKGVPYVYLNTRYGGVRYIGQSQFPVPARDWNNSGTSLLHDFNKDGIADLLTWPGNSYDTQFGGTPEYTYYKGTRVLPIGSRVASRDFDGDAKSDILWRNARTGANAIWKSGASSNRQLVTGITDPDWKVPGIGDFDGDGTDDMLWRHESTGANVYWRAANFNDAQSMKSVTNMDWQVVGAGDFNGDNRDDVLWRNARTGANAIWRSADAAAPQVMRGVTGLAWKVAAIGNFDGDARDDVLWRNATTGANAIWRSANAATTRAMKPLGTAWHLAGVGDFNGDGKDDILWRHTTTGLNIVWHSANASTTQRISTVPDQDWRVASVGDYDDDGRSDILWRNQRSGANAIWHSASATSQQPVARLSDTDWFVVR